MKSRATCFLVVLGSTFALGAMNVLGQDAVEEHVVAARTAAASEHTVLFEELCTAPQPAPPAQATSATAPVPGPPDRALWHADPVKVFDNLYYVGQTEYSSWAVITSEGIIVIDPIFDYSVEDEIVGGLTTLGFDPATIKYVVVSHAHRDHVGGARYLQDRFGAHVIMGAADWDLLDRNTQPFQKPRRDLVAADGQELVLGDTTLTLYVTPGHTLGTISTLIPLKDGASSHVGALWGGTAFNWLRSAAYITPETPASFWFESYVGSADRFREIATAAGADVLLSNHPKYDGSVTKLPAMSERKQGDPHPYVVGNESVERYLTVAAECAKAGLARLGEGGAVAVPEPSEKALRYFRGGNVLWVVNTVWGLLVPAAFLFTGFSARIRDWAQRFGRKWFFVIGLYFVIFALINFVIDFPLSYYQGFVREHAYDLSNQTFGKWFGDSLKTLLVSMITGVLFLWIPYLLLKKSPRRWWLYTGMLAVPFLFFFMLVSPIWIDPLFNEFGPMNDQALEAKILALAEKSGIEGSRVFEVNKSVDTKTVNAYVAGFLGTKRIVLWDTILAKFDEEELLFVMGHEMGHYVLGHDVKGVFFFSLLIMIMLYAAYRSAGGLISRFKNRFGFDQLSDIASLPLILVLVSIFSLVVTPVALTFTRHIEHEADRFGLEITQTNHAAATAFVKLQEDILAVPRPGLLYKLWRASHPVLGDRIDFCNSYRPWEQGTPMKYETLFKE